ncbi:hypothetical protein ACFFUP_18640 [Vibrio ostreicida]|uniref:DUF3630 family protein n=1 Tax=Vibrio ostreicida TaxID=526588 RepID=A0ABT8BPW0_9VIBR|nr:hypothetical protein [Vibrio ostreicida]MDN3608847.1 hypothetical protein [Vibrio ostreicida]NPD09881.1 hypothetical protein [Vibrio ostreicida]
MKIISFHESTVVQFYVERNTALLLLEGVTTDSLSDKVQIVIDNFSTFLVDGVVHEDLFFMPFSDGEVLVLELNDDGYYMLIEWHDFSPHTSFIQEYEFKTGKINTLIL